MNKLKRTLVAITAIATIATSSTITAYAGGNYERGEIVWSGTSETYYPEYGESPSEIGDKFGFTAEQIIKFAGGSVEYGRPILIPIGYEPPQQTEITTPSSEFVVQEYITNNICESYDMNVWHEGGYICYYPSEGEGFSSVADTMGVPVWVVQKYNKSIQLFVAVRVPENYMMLEEMSNGCGGYEEDNPVTDFENNETTQPDPLAPIEMDESTTAGVVFHQNGYICYYPLLGEGFSTVSDKMDIPVSIISYYNHSVIYGHMIQVPENYTTDIEETVSNNTYYVTPGTLLSETYSQNDPTLDSWYNICHATDILNNTVVEPGGVFDFYSNFPDHCTNPLEWKTATYFISPTKTGECVGSGICFPSSITHVTGVKGGLISKERHDHAQEVTYLPKGLDAAVAYFGEDDIQNMKLLNPFSFAVQFKYSYNNETGAYWCGMYAN